MTKGKEMSNQTFNIWKLENKGDSFFSGSAGSMVYVLDKNGYPLMPTNRHM